MKISFCVTCMNRLYQLEKTLPYNLKVIESMDDVEICLVNYNSADGLDEYIKTHFMDAIKSGKLRYFYTKEPQYFHCSKAKNLAHRLGLGDILFNLDSDNFISEETVRFIKNCFSQDNNIFLHDGKLSSQGSFGRIAAEKKVFLGVGGYDESMLGVSTHDNDLIFRLSRIGLKKIRSYTSPLDPIKNTNKETISNQASRMPYFFYLIINGSIRVFRLLFRKAVNPKGMQKFSGILNFQHECRI